jgi:putative transposase
LACTAARARVPAPSWGQTARVLGVSESGYYESRRRGASARAVRHAWLTDLIDDVHTVSRGTYGIRRVHAKPTLGRGLVVARGTVEMLTNRADIHGVIGWCVPGSPESGWWNRVA